MSASAALLTDVATILTNGPNGATTAKANAAAGPIMGYTDNVKLVQLKLQEASVLATEVKRDIDSSDSANLALLNGVLAAINGTSNPTTTAVTDLDTIVSNGHNAATHAKTNSPTGPILEPSANLSSVRLKLREANTLITQIQNATDSSDSANAALLVSVKLTLT